MANAVYLLCALTSLACAGLLLRGYARSRSRLLLWSGLCFVGLAANNLLMCAEIVVAPDRDLRWWRSVAALTGLSLLLYGLVWETRPSRILSARADEASWDGEVGGGQ